LLLFLGSIVILVDHVCIRERSARVLRAAVVGWVLVLILVGFRADNFRSDGPEWQPAVARARRACEGRPRDAEVRLVIPPEAFSVSVPCRDLR